MAKPTGFEWTERKNGDVVITHNKKVATVLRNAKAVGFVEAVRAGDPQEVMARATGNYKRGNERQASRHPRRRDRRS